MDASDLGRSLVYLGLGVAALGGIVLLLGRVLDGTSLTLGRLPGDIVYEGESTRIYAPITTMIVVSLVLTLLVNAAVRLLR
jgi:hypothetical protein